MQHCWILGFTMALYTCVCKPCPQGKHNNNLFPKLSDLPVGGQSTRYNVYVFQWREVHIKKNFSRGLECTVRPAPLVVRAVHSRPRVVNIIFIFLLSFMNENQSFCCNVCMPSAGFRQVKSNKCQLWIQDWQSSIQAEEMVPSDELVNCFYHFCTLTFQVGQCSHLNSCIVRIYLRIGDVYERSRAVRSLAERSGS